MKRTILAAFLLAGSSAAHAAGAPPTADIMLNVPVDVSNMKLGENLYVHCRLCDHPQPGRCNAARTQDVIAQKSATVPLVNGNYSGTMQIVFANLPETQARRATVYECRLSDHASQGPTTGKVPAGTSVNYVSPALIKANTKPVTTVEGSLPIQAQGKP